MPLWDGQPNWTHGTCESCLKNAGDTIRMVREGADSHVPGFLVCPQCGATKRL